MYSAPGWVNVDIGLYAALARLPAPALRVLYRRSAWNGRITEEEYIRTVKSRPFIQHDLARGIPFHDGAVDYIFASHFLDSLTRAEGQHIISEMFRVLRPGGLVRLAVSDFARNVACYTEGRREEALQRFFPQSNSRANLRYFMYDFETLEAALTGAGFAEVRRREFQTGELPDVQLLDNRPDESLFVEARKARNF